MKLNQSFSLKIKKDREPHNTSLNQTCLVLSFQQNLNLSGPNSNKFVPFEITHFGFSSRILEIGSGSGSSHFKSPGFSMLPKKSQAGPNHVQLTHTLKLKTLQLITGLRTGTRQTCNLGRHAWRDAMMHYGNGGIRGPGSSAQFFSIHSQSKGGQWKKTRLAISTCWNIIIACSQLYLIVFKVRTHGANHIWFRHKGSDDP